MLVNGVTARLHSRLVISGKSAAYAADEEAGMRDKGMLAGDAVDIVDSY